MEVIGPFPDPPLPRWDTQSCTASWVRVALREPQENNEEIQRGQGCGFWKYTVSPAPLLPHSPERQEAWAGAQAGLGPDRMAGLGPQCQPTLPPLCRPEAKNFFFFLQSYLFTLISCFKNVNKITQQTKAGIDSAQSQPLPST